LGNLRNAKAFLTVSESVGFRKNPLLKALKNWEIKNLSKARNQSLIKKAFIVELL
jgi:hypothetical protein